MTIDLAALATGHKVRETEARPSPQLTLIVAVEKASAALLGRIQAFERSTTAFPTEILVACQSPWADAPAHVGVVVTGTCSRGDMLDRASEDARGEFIAFVGESVELCDGWQELAFRLLEDPTIGAVGGPQLPPANASSSQRAAWVVLSSWLGSGPLSHRFRQRPAHSVPDLPTTNLVVRRSAFVAVGGFQSPSPMGEDARLCYKLRKLLGLRVQCDPGLAVVALPGANQKPIFALVFQWGRKRGDLLRRLPETAGYPYPFPAFALFASLLVVALAPFNVVARLAAIAIVCTYAFAGIWMVIRSHSPRVGLRAAVGLPLTHLAYAIGLWNGYLGRSLGEIAPDRFHRRPVRILIMNWRDVAHPWSGGAEAYMHELGRRWVKSGCEVGWLSERPGTAKRVETIDGIRIYRVGGKFSVYPLAALLYLLRLRNRYDVIVDCQNGVPFFAPLYARKQVILVVFHVHSEIFRRELGVHLRWFAHWLESWLMPRAYRRRQIVTISSSTLAELAGRGYDPARIDVVVPGVDAPDGELPDERGAPPLLVYLGRLKAYKGVDILLRAMPKILASFPDATLAIIGQGPERERLERLAWGLGLASRARFCGYLSKRERNSRLARAWVTVCPSSFEGWGVVCLEANAWGSPVVASHVPGLKDAVVDGVTGVLVPYGDSDRLAEEVIRILADPERRRAMGDAGRSWARGHSWEKSADAFLERILATGSYAYTSHLGAASEID